MLNKSSVSSLEFAVEHCRICIKIVSRVSPGVCRIHRHEDRVIVSHCVLSKNRLDVLILVDPKLRRLSIPTKCHTKKPFHRTQILETKLPDIRFDPVQKLAGAASSSVYTALQSNRTSCENIITCTHLDSDADFVTLANSLLYAIAERISNASK